MPRVFLTCGDTALYETIRKSFLASTNFEICLEQNNGLDAIMEAIELFPDLVVLGQEPSPIDGLQIAEALKLSIPDVQVFLVSEFSDMEAEKTALSHGIDAVFSRGDDLSSVVLNAHAVCEADERSMSQSSKCS